MTVDREQLVARAIFDSMTGLPELWAEIDEEDREQWHETARAALVAALSPEGGEPLYRKCPTCGGNGWSKHGQWDCNTCRGEGYVAAALRLPSPEGRRFVGVDQQPHGCWAACISSITGIQLDRFPEAPVLTAGGKLEVSYSNSVRQVLKDNHWQIHHIWTSPPGATPLGWAIAGGPGPRGVQHAVVVYDGELIWDPHPSRAGVSAFDDFEIVVPLVGSCGLPLSPFGNQSVPRWLCERPHCSSRGCVELATHIFVTTRVCAGGLKEARYARCDQHPLNNANHVIACRGPAPEPGRG